MRSLELDIQTANVNLENGSVILTGVDLSQIINQVGTENILNEMDYLDITRYVDEQEKERAEWS